MEQDRKAKEPGPVADLAPAGLEKINQPLRLHRRRLRQLHRKRRERPRLVPEWEWAADAATDADKVAALAVEWAVAAVAVVETGAASAADVAGVDFRPLDGYAYDLF